MSSIRCIGRSLEESATPATSGPTTLNGESIRPNLRNSILAFIIYRSWVNGPPLDLREAEVSVYLRGDHLDLKGAQCYFWALDQEIGTRWHYVSQPLKVNQDQLGKAAAVSTQESGSSLAPHLGQDTFQPCKP